MCIAYMSERQERLDAEFKERMEEYERNLFEFLRVNGAYSAMEKEVLAWEVVNPEHQGLKDFMLEQLRTGAPTMYPSNEPEKQTLEAWTKAKLYGFEWSINFHREGLELERKKIKSLNKYIDDLMKVAPPPFEIKQNKEEE